MKKTMNRIVRSATALLLSMVMLCNLVACAWPQPYEPTPSIDIEWTTVGLAEDQTEGEAVTAGTTASTSVSAPETEDTTAGTTVFFPVTETTTEAVTSATTVSSAEETTPPAPTVTEPELEVTPAVIHPAQKQPLVGVSADTGRTTVPAELLVGYNTAVTANRNDGLASYAVSQIAVVYDTNADEYGVVDTVTVNDTICLEQGYHALGEEELTLSSVYADYYEVEVDYTKDGKVAGLYYYDRYYIYHYDTAGRLTEIYRDGKLYKSFQYNANGNIVKEVSNTVPNAFAKTYSYTEEGGLHSVDNVPVRERYAIDSSFFEYNHMFNGEKYLTSKRIGGVLTTYKYVGDKVVEISKGGNTVAYILDRDLNYVGLSYNNVKYYFAVDPFGNVMGLADCEGRFAVEYQYDIWGNIVGITGSLAKTLGSLNEIVNLNGIYDSVLNCYFFGENIYFPESGMTVTDGVAVCARSMYEWEQSNYFSRSAVSAFARIHDMVVEVAVKALKDEGLDVVSRLYVSDKNGDPKRLVDIYTLDYSITPFSTMNLLNGNQVYEVIYHAPESEKFHEIALNKLQRITDIKGDWSVSYFADYKPTAGTMSFHGQFIYLDYLIDYKCAGNGIVEYQIKKNIKKNYDQTVNIYDYDNDRYVCYVNNTFDLEFLEGVTIIPGINREQYKAIEGYLTEYLQSVAGNICDQMLIYDDPNYYDLESMNVRPDYWAQMNLEDTVTYLEIRADGSVSVNKMPSWETNQFRTKVKIGAGVILVTAVIATIAIAIPGANCVVVSICVGAAKGAVAGAASGFAMGFVTPVINMAVEGVTTGNWKGMSAEEYLDQALNAAADGFASGAITGAILGGISGGLNPKYCFEAGTPVATPHGAVAIESIAVGDAVWSYDYQTGERSLNPVSATAVRETDRIITLRIGGETVVTTPEHPFYVVNNERYHGYVAAKYLTVGDCIQTADGGWRTVEAIRAETLDEPVTVYNLTVEDNHSYYVGEVGLLVHNFSCKSLNGRSDTYQDWTREDYLNNIDDIDLRQAANRLYRKNAIIGDGGTADAVRYTKTTGRLVGGSDHIQKAQDQVTHLKSLINKGNLSYHDEQIAWSLLRDLEHALDFMV